MGELSFSIPNAVRLGDIAKYIAPDLYEAAQARVKEGIKQSGRIVITPAQWRELCELEAKNREKLPEPFSREVLLRDFCLEIADTDYLVSYRQSEFASVNLKDGRKLEPKVDCLIGWRDHIELYKDGRWRKKGENPAKISAKLKSTKTLKNPPDSQSLPRIRLPHPGPLRGRDPHSERKYRQQQLHRHRASGVPAAGIPVGQRHRVPARR